MQFAGRRLIAQCRDGVGQRLQQGGGGWRAAAGRAHLQMLSTHQHQLQDDPGAVDRRARTGAAPRCRRRRYRGRWPGWERATFGVDSARQWTTAERPLPGEPIVEVAGAVRAGRRRRRAVPGEKAALTPGPVPASARPEEAPLVRSLLAHLPSHSRLSVLTERRRSFGRHARLLPTSTDVYRIETATATAPSPLRRTPIPTPALSLSPVCSTGEPRVHEVLPTGFGGRRQRRIDGLAHSGHHLLLIVDQLVSEDIPGHDSPEDILRGGVVAQHDAAAVGTEPPPQTLHRARSQDKLLALVSPEQRLCLRLTADEAIERGERTARQRLGQQNALAGAHLLRRGHGAVAQILLYDQAGALQVERAEFDDAQLLPYGEQIHRAEHQICQRHFRARRADHLGQLNAQRHAAEVGDGDLRLALGGDVGDVIVSAGEGAIHGIARGRRRQHRTQFGGVGRGGDEQERLRQDAGENLQPVPQRVEQRAEEAKALRVRVHIAPQLTRPQHLADAAQAVLQHPADGGRLADLVAALDAQRQQQCLCAEHPDGAGHEPLEYAPLRESVIVGRDVLRDERLLQPEPPALEEAAHFGLVIGIAGAMSIDVAVSGIVPDELAHVRAAHIKHRVRFGAVDAAQCQRRRARARQRPYGDVGKAAWPP
eukprot:ctg_1892.g712